MSENKTRPGDGDLSEHLDALADPAQRRDCQQLIELMQAESGEAPLLWGSSIVGFGRYRYVYDSGRAGEAPRCGFAARSGKLVIYLMTGFDRFRPLLAGLGAHSTGSACLYLKLLSDVNIEVLRQLISASLEEVSQRYPD